MMHKPETSEAYRFYNDWPAKQTVKHLDLQTILILEHDFRIDSRQCLASAYPLAIKGVNEKSPKERTVCLLNVTIFYSQVRL